MTLLIILISLWTYPIIAYILTRLTISRISFRSRLIKLTLLITGLSILGLITNISTTSKAIDWVLLTSIYFSVCLFLWLSYFYTNKILRILAMVGMIGIYSIGYLSSTIGVLGVGFVSEEFDPNVEKWLGNGLIYKETGLGNAISDYRGKRVEIYRTISWLPIFEWRILHKEYFNITIINNLQVDYHPDIKAIYLSGADYWGKDGKLENWKDTLKLGQEVKEKRQEIN